MTFKVEFHCHTIYSKDSLARLSDVLQVTRERGIDRVVITDHNTIRGALAARKLDAERVIVGEEILTADGGEVLAAFVSEEIPAGLPYLEVIRRLKDQGAFISLSHPFDYNRVGWQENDLTDLIDQIDAVEVFNARAVQSQINERAQRFADLNGLAGTVGSDAHCLREYGRATLFLPEFNSADDLRRVIRSGVPEVRLSSPLIHFYSTYAKLAKRIGGKQFHP